MMRNGNGNTSNTPTTITTKPASDDKSGWVLLLGGGLIAANFAFGGGSEAVSYVFSPVKPSNIPAVDWTQYVLMSLALIGLLIISKAGGSNFAVIFLVAVWILWLLNSQGAVQKILGQSTTTGTTANSATTGNAPPTANTSTTNKKSTGQKPA